MYRHALTMMVAVAAIACGATPTEPTRYASSSRAVASENKINEWIPISALAFSFCHDEVIDVVGKGHIVESFFPDGSISLHVNTADLTGTGESSGLTYNVIETGREELAAGPGTDVTATIHYRAITRGSEQNDLLDITVHVFVDEDGNIQQEIVKLRSACVG
jgi:hypothetical protein